MRLKIKTLLILVLMSINLFALECNDASFNKGEKEIKEVISFYKKSSTTEEERKSKINKNNYDSDMKTLKKTLTSLNEKKSYIFLANMTNDDNINTWKALKKTCQGRDLRAVKKQQEDAQKRKILIHKKMEHINRSISNKQFAIKIGEEKYKPLKLNQ